MRGTLIVNRADQVLSRDDISTEPTKVSELSAPLGHALRNVLLTLTLTIFTFAFTGYFWREAGYEMLIVTMGWPHVILGFVFYLGRVLRGERNSRTSFLILVGVTIVLWTIHYQYQITGLIYLYFLFHLFRDEIFVYVQTRSRHRTIQSVYSVAGVGPLILLMLLIPKQQDFRQDMRRVDFNSSQIASDSWTLIPFRPVETSRGREFYFYLQAPHTANLRTLITYGTSNDSRSDGAMLVGDHRFPRIEDLIFVPRYADDRPSSPIKLQDNSDRQPVLLTGGHRVGQTFTAEKNNLSGIWLPISHLEQSDITTQFSFHLASPSLLPYSDLTTRVRDILILILSAFVVWRLIPTKRRGSQLWVYLLVLAGSFAVVQTLLKSSSNAGYPFPLIFQFAVVFHYFSWYVFSFDKLATLSDSPAQSSALSRYEKILGYLRRTPSFALTMVALNLISAAGVIWYYRIGGPGLLRYVFDYNCFLYILVFHVTFSFRPRLSFDSAQAKIPTRAVG